MENKKRQESNTNSTKQANQQSIGTPRHKQLKKQLESLWNLKNVPYRGTDEVVSQITNGKRASKMDPTSLKKYLTIASLGTKLEETKQVLKSDDELFIEFINKQQVPALNSFLIERVKAVADELFSDFDFNKLYKDLKDPGRKHYVSNGSSYPQSLCPIIDDHYVEDDLGKKLFVKGNRELIVTSLIADDGILYQENEFHELLYGKADIYFSTVPKNFKTNRPIGMTNRINMDEHLFVSNILRKYVTKRTASRNKWKYNHLIQFNQQELQHKALVKGYGTIDISSFTDTMYKKLCSQIMPEFFELFGDILPSTVIYNDEVYDITCNGTQGHPLTFTIGAIAYGCILAAYKTEQILEKDHTIKVSRIDENFEIRIDELFIPAGTPFYELSLNYGDDDLSHELDYENHLGILTAFHLEVNLEKSFLWSQGVMESCGMWVRFLTMGDKTYSYDITPIHLRGEQDVNIITFFNQLLSVDLLTIEECITILKNLGCKFYAFDYEYPITAFHIPYGIPVNIGYPSWDKLTQQYTIDVPHYEDEILSIKGLNKAGSDFVMKFIKLHEIFSDGMANQQDVEYSILKEEYTPLDIEIYDFLISEEILYTKRFQDQGVTRQRIAFFRIIVRELSRYTWSEPFIKNRENVTIKVEMQSNLRKYLGLKEKTNFPIYRFRGGITTKTIPAPIELTHAITKNTFIV